MYGNGYMCVAPALCDKIGILPILNACMPGAGRQ